MKSFLVGLLAIVALAVAFAPAGSGGTNHFRPGGVVPHFSHGPNRLAAQSTTAAAGFDCGPISCDAYQAGIDGYFQNVAADSGTGNNVYSVANQYSDTTGNIAYNEKFGGSYVDSHPFPSNGCPVSPTLTVCLTESQLVSEIGKALTANGWTPGGTHLFFIFLPADVNTCFDRTPSNPKAACASNAFCAYHDSSSSLIFAVEPFNASFGCHAGTQGYPNGAEIDQSVNTVSHEQIEAITDPNQSNNAWYSSSQDEIGDLCAWSFGAPLGTTGAGQSYNQVINGHDYSLQLEYSNAANGNAGGCVSHLGGAASPISDGGTGPLTYHGGPVMRSNTVYSIYWFPPPPTPTPESSGAPMVSGTTAVGQQLSTSDGTWTNSPTSYSYRWQRCDSNGMNCLTIAKATTATYKLILADGGHTVRSEVLASNSGGPAAAGYTPSLATAVVIGKPASLAVKPTLSGTAKVGQTLSVTNGDWSYSPTSYAYQWFRCTSAGLYCKKIVGATSSSYLLVGGDRNHKLRANVTAANSAGSTTVSSNKSGKVKK
jgi:hypothetical protein